MPCSPVPFSEAAWVAPPSPTSATCPWAEVEVAGRASLAIPDAGISRAFSLPRARIAGGLAYGSLAAARVEVTAVRSGGAAGYIGVDGEALVPEVQIAEARVAWPAWGLAGGAGVVDDPWVVSGDAAQGLRDVAPGFGEGAGWMDRSDVGAWIGWGAPRRLVSARVDLSAGEGARFRERNEGKNVAATVTIRPLQSTEDLAVTVYGRDGSRGLGLARDHRVGLRVSGAPGGWTWGAEGLAAWGVGGDADRQPVAASVWFLARPAGPLLVYGRLDLASEALGEPDAGSTAWFAGAGLDLGGDARPVRILVGYQGTRVDDGVAAVSGAADLEDADVVLLQVGVHLRTPEP